MKFDEHYKNCENSSLEKRYSSSEIDLAQQLIPQKYLCEQIIVSVSV